MVDEYKIATNLLTRIKLIIDDVWTISFYLSNTGLLGPFIYL